MATIQLVYRSAEPGSRQGEICIKISQRRRFAMIPTGYFVSREEWDPAMCMPVARGDSSRSEYLSEARSGLAIDLARAQRMASRIESRGQLLSPAEIAEAYSRNLSDISFFGNIQNHSSRLRNAGRIRTSETYIASMRSFRKFRNGEDLPMDAITGKLLEEYQTYLYSRGLIPNTVSFYMRVLRAVYNKAVEEDLIDDRKPFRKVYTGIARTRKRALRAADLRLVREMDLGGNPALQYARDIFLLSFYLRGMSFIDMAFLRVENLHDGVLTYRRRKTGQTLKIAWTGEMQEILKRYPSPVDGYLLPIIKKADGSELSSYRNAAYNINRNLKEIGRKAGFGFPLTMYVARHSWATVAKNKGVPISVISEGMGHESESTTRIYLASLDTSLIDRANELIISAI